VERYKLFSALVCAILIQFPGPNQIINPLKIPEPQTSVQELKEGQKVSLDLNTLLNDKKIEKKEFFNPAACSRSL